MVPHQYDPGRKPCYYHLGHTTRHCCWQLPHSTLWLPQSLLRWRQRIQWNIKCIQSHYLEGVLYMCFVLFTSIIMVICLVYLSTFNSKIVTTHACYPVHYHCLIPRVFHCPVLIAASDQNQAVCGTN